MGNYIGNNVHSIRTNYGLSQTQLAKIAKVSQTAVSSWECGQTIPRLSNAQRIVDAFADLEMDDIYSQALGYSRRVLRHTNAVPEARYLFAPLYGSIAAGEPIEMLPTNESAPIPGVLAKRYPHAFYLRISGESMNRRLPNGSLALVNPESTEVESGKVYAVCVGSSDATVKRVRKLKNGVALEPDSMDPTYKPQVFDYAETDTDQTLSVIGRVVWFAVPYDFDI